MGAKGLRSYALRSYGVEMRFEEAVLYRRRFFETYPALKRWHEREQRTWQRGETETQGRPQTGAREGVLEPSNTNNKGGPSKR
jgi:hypothetical protein